MDVSGQLHTPAALNPGEGVPGTHRIGTWVGPRASLDAVEKRKFLHCRELSQSIFPYQTDLDFTIMYYSINYVCSISTTIGKPRI
jgi:hypothetical protein